MTDKRHADAHDDPLQSAREFLSKDDEGRSKSGPWMTSLAPHLTVLTADPKPPARVTFSFVCQQDHCNRLGNLHGGAAATLFDVCTTVAVELASRPGFWQYLGVTRNLNVTYFRPVPVGSEVIIEAEAMQMGKRLCTLKGVMRRKSDGEIMSICEHSKANIDPEPKI